MEWLWQLRRFDNDPRIKFEKNNARLRERAFDPIGNWPIQLQPPVLSELGYLPTGDDTNSEDPAGALLEKFAMPGLQSVRM